MPTPVTTTRFRILWQLRPRAITVSPVDLAFYSSTSLIATDRGPAPQLLEASNCLEQILEHPLYVILDCGSRPAERSTPHAYRPVFPAASVEQHIHGRKGHDSAATATTMVRLVTPSGGPWLKTTAQLVPISPPKPRRKLHSSRRPCSGAYAHKQPNTERTNVRVNVTLLDTKSSCKVRTVCTSADCSCMRTAAAKSEGTTRAHTPSDSGGSCGKMAAVASNAIATAVEFLTQSVPSFTLGQIAAATATAQTRSEHRSSWLRDMRPTYAFTSGVTGGEGGKEDGHHQCPWRKTLVTMADGCGCGSCGCTSAGCGCTGRA